MQPSRFPTSDDVMSHRLPLRWLRASLCAAAALAVFALGSRPAAAQQVSDLAHGIDLLNGGDLEGAAPIFFDVAENSGQQELQYRAEYYLALTLYKMNLYHSALYYDSTIIDEGPNHPYYSKAVENTLDVMDATGDKTTIPFLLDKYYNDAFAKLGKQVIDRVNFIVALWDSGQRKLEDSIAFLDAVKPDAVVYPRALYLRGVQYASEAKNGDAKQNEKAAAKFEAVLKLNTDTVPYTDLDALKNLATVALARVKYYQGKFGEAYELYAKIPRYSKQWRDALFEGAYAAFMNDDYGHALGMLHTLHAPVAGNQFVPESWLLEGTLYYYDCLFDESRAALAKLQDIYSTQTLTALKNLNSTKHDPEVFFNLLTKGSQDNLMIPENVRNELFADDSLTARRAYIAELAAEGTRLQAIDSWKGSLLQKALLEAVSEQRNKLIQAAGTAINRTLRQLQANLEDFDGQAEIVKFEMAKREKDQLESGYDSEKQLAKQRLGRPQMPGGDAEYWGFDGEYWPDELGYYQFTLKNACPPETAEASPAAGQ